MVRSKARHQCFPSCMRRKTNRWLIVLLHIGAVVIAHRCQGWHRCARTRISPSHSTTILGLHGGDEQPAIIEGRNNTRTNVTAFSGNETGTRQRRRRWFGQSLESNQTLKIQKRTRRWFILFDARNNENRVGLQNATSPSPKSGGNINITAPMTNASSSASSVPTTNRGGAAVKEQPPRWFAPPADRLVERFKNIQNVWWVNAWAEQLPTPRDEEEMARKQLDAAANRTEELRRQQEMTKERAASLTNQSAPAQATQPGTAEKDNALSGKDGTRAMNHTVKAPDTKPVQAPKSNYFNQKKRHRSNDSIPNTAMTNVSAVHRKVKEKHRPKHITVPLPSNITAVSPKGAYLSSGYWSTIDQIFTLGFAKSHPRWRVSSKLRPLRKAAARATGLHGVLSGKPKQPKLSQQQIQRVRQRMAALDRAKRNLEELSNNVDAKKKSIFGLSVFMIQRKRKKADYRFVLKDATEQELRDNWTEKRLKQIGKEMHEAQQRLARLACEKDVLQERHNPLWKYSVPDVSTWARSKRIHPERQFAFPSEDLVDEYLDMLFATGRLVKLNHTDLWRSGNKELSDDDDELSGPSPSSNVDNSNIRATNTEASTAGNWLLRNGLGELIGEKAELAAYKAVCKAIMEILAKGLSSLHGLTVMDHSDIRISTEETPQLPPIAGHIPGSKNYRDYAENAINNAIRSRPRRPQARRDNDFIQKAAIVETLTSQCQLAAPIMNLFPLTWQRAIISNIISLVTAVIADFCEGIEFQILGHKLSISFTPITQEEMLQRLYAHGSSPRRKDAEGFEDAVRATAETLSENLKLLDRWHQRALGSGVLVMQISTLIARLVLFLVDDILCASRMDLWSAHTGGPRLLAGFEYRTSTHSTKSPTSTEDSSR